MNIDQDMLCDFCKNDKDMSDSYHCEGRFCTEMQEKYLDNYGIADEKTAFSHVKITDNLYIISNDILYCKEVEGITTTKATIVFNFADMNISVAPSVKESKDGGIYIYIGKDIAVAAYEKMIAEKIISMAKTLSEFK